MSELVPFNDGEIRVVEHEGRKVAYMPDVARTFGLRTNNVIPALDEWDYVNAGAEFSAHALSCGNFPVPSPYWLTESGINHLAYKLSPELRRAVNERILPALRKTGVATVADANPASDLSRRDILQMALEAEDARLAAEAKVAELEPRAEMADAFLKRPEDLIGIQHAWRMSKDIHHLSEPEFFALLRAWKIIFANGTTIQADFEKRGIGKNMEIPRKEGEKYLDKMQGKLTKYGLEYILDRIKRFQRLAIESERTLFNNPDEPGE